MGSVFFIHPVYTVFDLTTEEITTHLYFVFALMFSLYLVLQVHISIGNSIISSAITDKQARVSFKKLQNNLLEEACV